MPQVSFRLKANNAYSRKLLTDSLGDGNRVSRSGRTVDGGVGLAVNLSVDSLEVLQVEGDAALSALEAPLVEVLVSSLNILKRVHRLGADLALVASHFD